jgi:chemotaxis protein methyltransferase CheR
MTYLTDAISLNDQHFTLLRDLIHQRLGLYYENGRRDLLQDRLAPLLAERGLTSFLDYYYLLKYDSGGDSEWFLVQSALAVRETYFFREYDSLQAAAQVLIPAILQQAPERTIRIWSAAAASGEEPYSLAIALEEAGVYGLGNIDIMASDFDLDALKLARQGVYRHRSFRSAPPDLLEKYFQPLDNGYYHISPAIIDRVRFFYLNLMDAAQAAPAASLDLILCRNAFIYFSTESTQAVTQQFFDLLRPGGLLILGASESLIKIDTDFKLDQLGTSFFYRKNKQDDQ